MQIVPFITARKSHQGHKTISKAFTRYFHIKTHESRLACTKDRFTASRKHSCSIEGIAKFECEESIATLVNTIPVVSSMIDRIYSTPIIHEEIRQGLTRIMIETPEKNSSTARKVDIAQIKTSCLSHPDLDFSSGSSPPGHSVHRSVKSRKV